VSDRRSSDRRARDRRRQKVVMRRSHQRYRWKQIFGGLWFLIRWGGLAGVIAGSIAAGGFFWHNSTWFKVKSVQIDRDAPAGFTKRLGIAPGDHMFGFSARLLHARLLDSYPELEDVSIYRWPGGTVRVRVERRVPAAKTFDGERWLAMDAQGVLFPLFDEKQGEGLTVVAGLSGAAAVPLLEFVQRLKDEPADWARRVQKVKATSLASVFLYLEDGTPVYWGEVPKKEEILEMKTRRLERVLKDESLAAGVEYVRFVDNDRLAVKPKKIEPREKGASRG